MATENEEVITEVARIFRQVLNNEAIVLKPETTANDVKGWDSLSHLELVIAVEKRFKVRFNFAEMQKFRNVGDWCDNIAAKLARAGASAPKETR